MPKVSFLLDAFTNFNLIYLILTYTSKGKNTQHQKKPKHNTEDFSNFMMCDYLMHHATHYALVLRPEHDL